MIIKAGNGVRRSRTLGLSSGVVVAIVTAMSLSMLANASVSAAASPAWATVPSSNLALPNGALNSVSCVSAAMCMAVGSFQISPSATKPLAEEWNGEYWTIKSTPNPAGLTTNVLTSVSCSTTDACMAVGDSTGSSTNGETLAELWNGSTWAIEPIPTPKPSYGVDLQSVSCTSPTACVAVGSYEGTQNVTDTLAEVWNGTAWTLSSSENETGSSVANLEAVSCTKASSCTAAGYYLETSGPYLPLIEAYNGTVWSLQTTPSLAGASGYLYGLSCGSGTDTSYCVAVGNSPGSPDGLIDEMWNGTRWVLGPTPPSPNGSAAAFFDAVSCTSASDCVAVGSDDPSPGVSDAFVEAWNGTAWSVQPLAAAKGTQTTILSGVSCEAAASCVSVGTAESALFLNVPYGEVRATSVWSLATPGAAAAQVGIYELNGVSCVSAAACFAVGDEAYGDGSRLAVVDQWNGTQFTSVAAAPYPSPSRQSLLGDVSCGSATDCLAVGYYDTTKPLAESWNGTSWNLLAPLVPAGAQQTTLTSVSCAGTACTVVGDYEMSGSVAILAERWNGTSWSMSLPLSASSGTSGQLTGVSCMSATMCVAVGYGSSGSLVEVWNGTTWTSDATGIPAGVDLDAISCGGSSSCMAIGGGESDSWSWNGSTWSGKALATLPGGNITRNALSCVSGSDCELVGTFTSSEVTGEEYPVAETWNGTAWTAAPTVGTTSSGVLSAISCSSTVACMAVGAKSNLTLAEQYGGSA